MLTSPFCVAVSYLDIRLGIQSNLLKNLPQYYTVNGRLSSPKLLHRVIFYAAGMFCNPRCTLWRFVTPASKPNLLPKVTICSRTPKSSYKIHSIDNHAEMDWTNVPIYERFRNRLGCNVSVIGDGRDEVLPTYTMPLPPEGTSEEEMPILYPICPGGAGGIRTPYLLTASQTFSQVNYGPMNAYLIYHR
jgi:hypothetical protein